MESFASRIPYVAIQFVPFLIAVIFHEFAHGFVANLWGDQTAKNAGRLTLNPLPHIDPIGTLLFPLINMFTGIPILIGWAKPVPINPSRFRKYRPGLFWVSAAGPLMNFSLGLLSAAIVCALVRWMPRDFFYFDPLSKMAVQSVILNFALGIFNLLPIPPLDGSKIIESFLSFEATRKYEAISQYSFYILLALMFSGALSILHGPILFMAQLSLGMMEWIFGVGLSSF